MCGKAGVCDIETSSAKWYKYRANVREGVRGQTKPDFIAKMSVAQKEAEETCYWLELLYESGYINKSIFESMYRDNLEINRILASIILTARQNLKNQLKPKAES